MNFIRCECGVCHFPSARFCEGCGAQPPRPFGTLRDETDMDPGNLEDFYGTVIALTKALEMTRGKWAIA